MTNRRMDQVGFRRFGSENNLTQSLLAVDHPDGSLEWKVAQGMANLADQLGRQAAIENTRRGEAAGNAAAAAGAPGAMQMSAPTTASRNGQAGHIRGAGSGPAASAPGELDGVIRQAAAKYGVNADAMVKMAGIESGYNPKAFNASSKASGLFQFIPSTAKQYGLVNPFDAVQSADAAARLARDNAQYLQKSLGRAPSAGELYLAHQQGAGGAAKLLSNPNAKAADLVGTAAVVQNGGHADMTAAAFAAKWTGRFGPHVASVSPDGPVSVVPVEGSQHWTSGKPGSFRLMQGDSAYARAYNIAGTRTYMQELELTMLQDQQSVYDKYKDDPAKLSQAMDELLQAHMQDHVFPEIAPEYSLIFRKQAMAVQEQARSRAEMRQKQEDFIAFGDRASALETQKDRVLAGMQPGDAGTEQQLHALQMSVDSHYDAAVSRGIVDPTQAAEAKRKSRDDMLLRYYSGQAKGKKPEEILKMREDMRKEFAAGNLPELTGDNWQKLDASLLKVSQDAFTQGEQLNEALTQKGDALAAQVAAGTAASAADLSALQLQAGQAPKGKEIVASAIRRVNVADAIRTMPIPEVERNLSKLLGDTATPEDIKYAQDLLKKQKAAIVADPLSVAQQYGVIPVSGSLPLDAPPQELASAFQQRMSDATLAAKHFGVQPKYFQEGEAKAIEDAVKSDPDRGVSIAAGLVSAAGDNADHVLAELGEQAPIVTLAGNVVASGGSVAAAHDLIAGSSKPLEGGEYKDIPNEERKTAASGAAGAAFDLTPDEFAKAEQAATFIARKRLHDKGINAKDSANAIPVFKRAFQEAIGASFIGDVQFGGIADYDQGFNYSGRKVLVPNTIRADKFADVVGALTMDDIGNPKSINGTPWKASDFSSAIPVPMHGGYAFARLEPSTGNAMWIYDEHGRPIVIDFAGMKDRLSPRVPGAYR